MVAALLSVFIIGYFLIALEHTVNINKAATALITGVLCWTIYILSTSDKEIVSHQLTEHLADLSGILFFLLGAMTVVELIDAHDGFNIITDRIIQTDKRKLLWIISAITFFLSPLLDNLTTTIVMVSLIRKLIDAPHDRYIFAGMVVIAANAGGAWSPIGDVTTTMLWIGGQITAANITRQLFIPGLLSLVVPLLVLSVKMKGTVTRPASTDQHTDIILPRRQQYIVLCSGFAILVFVPIFKSLTHLPPYMAILIGLGVLWTITEVMHGRRPPQEKNKLSVSRALQKIDTPSILFFLGILLSISALQSTGILAEAATWMSQNIPSENAIALSIGLLSSVVDNVPLVAAIQGMYSLQQYPTDHFFWEFLAYTTGTGGSVLIIGSAAGVAAMGMEKISFTWYLRHISWLALIGFFAGALFYMFMA
ncbi:sodium:proton antiporter NhaD [Nemorincola caseinilytica]|uniref:Sodium:proton antiporter NhaD n=1 Tax=Nemorincola caseinilytica TaxID=2054315 RepID=A0ABP8NAW5_9BACT